METIQSPLPVTHSNLITTREIVQKDIRSLEARKRSLLDELSSVNNSLNQKYASLAELGEQVNNFDTNNVSVSRTFFLEMEFASFF